MHMGVQSRSRILIEMIDAIKNCADILIQAEEEDRILFDDQVLPTAFEITATLLTRASKMTPDKLDVFLKHIQVDGPEICQQMIKETLNKVPPIIHRSDLLDKLVKPPSA